MEKLLQTGPQATGIRKIPEDTFPLRAATVSLPEGQVVLSFSTILKASGMLKAIGGNWLAQNYSRDSGTCPDSRPSWRSRGGCPEHIL